MTASDLHTMARKLGVNLDSPTVYDLNDNGRGHIYPGGSRTAPCPFACGQAHGTQGNACPYQRVPVEELLQANPHAPRWWRAQVMRRA